MSLFQLIATAALFLAAKSEETPRPLNNVLRASCEIFHKQDISFLSYILPVVSIIDLSLGKVGAETIEMCKCHSQFNLHIFWFFMKPDQQILTLCNNSYFWLLSMHRLWKDASGFTNSWLCRAGLVWTISGANNWGWAIDFDDIELWAQCATSVHSSYLDS